MMSVCLHYSVYSSFHYIHHGDHTVGTVCVPRDASPEQWSHNACLFCFFLVRESKAESELAKCQPEASFWQRQQWVR